jgi:subtilisin family serine protease
MKHANCLVAISLIYTLLSPADGFAQKPDETPPAYPDISRGVGRGIRGGEPTDKMAPELRRLYGQAERVSSRGRGGDTSPAEVEYSKRDLQEIFGIETPISINSAVAIAVMSNVSDNASALKALGMKIYMHLGNSVYGEAPVLALAEIARQKNVITIATMKSAKMPEPPRQPDIPRPTERGGNGGNTTAANAPLANEFKKAGFTGKGVIVGVIDTGIDWRHKDFLRPDGSSRVVALWDLSDESNAESKGGIGTAPPQLFTGGERLPGTVYTNAQINAALKGTGTVNTGDLNGHGTAVAGTAAGNGRAVSGNLTPAMVVGVAPESDLIIVRASTCGSFSNAYLYGAVWMVQKAQELKRSIVINQSFGGHYSTHDGTGEEEQFLNQLTGKGKPGVVFTVSAGNEGLYSMHAAGRFGKKSAAQGDTFSRAISVNIPSERAGRGSSILALFDGRDDWGVAVRPTGNTVFVTKDGKPLTFYLFKVGKDLKYSVPQGTQIPDWFQQYMQSVLSDVQSAGDRDLLDLYLPAGSYLLWGFGASEKVVSGEFDLYAPAYYAVDFGMGTKKAGMVGSPGNAANVITVGAYNFRDSWPNDEQGNTTFNLQIGGISDYSSPGGRRRDGVVKPDIAAPATYTLAALSGDAKPGSKACEERNMGVAGTKFVTGNSSYIAWNGTSASSPFAAGVIALMLQKNPTLDAEQVRQILIKTARKGDTIGAVPNPEWGYGMLDPAAAIAATPLPGGPRRPRRK